MRQNLIYRKIDNTHIFFIEYKYIMTQVIQGQRCSGCRCLWEPNESDVKPSGDMYKTCNSCRKKSLENADKRKAYNKLKWIID
jgi:hypothetical protein